MIPHQVNTLRILGSIVVLMTLLMTAGCSMSRTINTTGGVIELPGKGPTRHFLIIGFGVVSCKAPEAETAVMVTDHTSLGVYAGDQPGLKLGVGYQQSTVTIVPNGLQADDVRIEVTRKPFLGLKILPHSAVLNELDKAKTLDTDGRR